MTRLAFCLALIATLFPRVATAQSLADLRWDTTETDAGRYVVVPGPRAFASGYNKPGLEIWTPPLQVVRDYWVSFRAAGDSSWSDGRTTLRSIESTPFAVTRVYQGSGVTLRERIVASASEPAATIAYSTSAGAPVDIIVHFTPSLNLMWPAGIGGQEIHWDATSSAYLLDEPSHRFRGAVLAHPVVAHDEWHNATHGAEFERSFAFTLRAAPGDTDVRVSFAGTTSPDGDPLAIARALAAPSTEEARARDRFAHVALLDVATPDSAVNRALHWAQATLEQAWVCNPQLGCGLVAGYGPSRGERRPQYAWFFGGDGLVAIDALLREGAYARAKQELEFILRYQDAKTGEIWHEMSQSAGLLDWAHAYPYMYAHVDISFDFLNTVLDYVRTTGDVAFARQHWSAIRAAYDYCRSTVPAGSAFPYIPAGQQGRDEQDPQRDELSLSLAWVSAAASFADLARLTGHAALAADAAAARVRARTAIRAAYYDQRRDVWVSGHLRSGAPVEGLTGGLIALLHQGFLSPDEQRRLLDELASPAYRTSWGIRSTPSNSPAYDPDAYARGSVWAIGTADAIRAFNEAGRSDVATSLWQDLVPWFALDAPGHMHEVLRGDVRAPERESVPDQTWSSASFISTTVQGTLGLSVNGVTRELRFEPRVPREWMRVTARHINVAGSLVDLSLQRSDDAQELEVDNAGREITLRFSPALSSGETVADVQLGGAARLAAPVANGREVVVICPAASRSRVTLHIVHAGSGSNR